MKTIRIFIASSSELKEDRDQLRMFVSQENDRLHKKGLYLEIVQWENFLDAISETRMQDEYNEALKQCDLVICLFFTKVGRFSEEEFDTAYELFKNEGKPKIWTYFKDASITTGSITDDFNSLLKFKNKLADLGHFYTRYTNIDNLFNQYKTQLERVLPELGLTPAVKETDRVEISKPENKPENHSFNEHLTAHLLQAIRPFNRKASIFLNENPNWQDNEQLHRIAKQIIISSYVGVLGLQLRKLMSIGQEPYSSGKLERYIQTCGHTVKRGLQLLNYALISTLWDKQINGDVDVKKESDEQLRKFFRSSTETNLYDEFKLTQSLLGIFSSKNLDIPIVESKILQRDPQIRQAIEEACLSLQELLKKNCQELAPEDCLSAENNVTKILEHLSFFAAYRMISLKDIHYSQQRNEKAGLYLHNYTYLAGENSDTSISKIRVRREDSPILSFAVLLFKDNFRQNINLDPFIIDYNGLALNGGSKICFYSHLNTYTDKKLNYIFIEDNSTVSFKKSDNPKPEDADVLKLNRWLAEPNNRKDLNFDNVYELFFAAKNQLINLDEETQLDPFQSA